FRIGLPVHPRQDGAGDVAAGLPRRRLQPREQSKEVAPAPARRQKFSQADPPPQEARPHLQNPPPQSFRPRGPPQPPADQRQPAPALAAAQVSRDAGEVQAVALVHQPYQGGVRAAPVSRLLADDPFEEEQLGVTGTDALALQADAQRLPDPAALEVAAGDQRVELADDGVARVRQLQALLQKRQRLLDAAQFAVG